MSDTTLKSTFAKVRKLDAKVVDAKNIKLKGQNIEQLWGLNLPKDYPKLVHGVKLPQDADYILCDNLGVPVYMTFNEKLTNGTRLFSNNTNMKQIPFEFPNLTNGNYMFYYCNNLTSFGNNTFNKLVNGDYMFYRCDSLQEINLELGELTSGYGMFQYCDNLQSVNVGNLEKLVDGDYMFYGCNLNGESVQNILSALPNHTDGATHKLKLTVQSSGATKFGEITGQTPTQDSSASVTYKGWSIIAYLK